LQTRHALGYTQFEVIAGLMRPQNKLFATIRDVGNGGHGNGLH
jgi:hypothetical protein